MKPAVLRQYLLLAYIHLPFFGGAQQTIPVADQTFRMDGQHTFVYAFAEGDAVELGVTELGGKKIKTVEFLPFAGSTIFSSYETDSIARQTIRIPHTGIYLLRFNESGAGKKICRFTLHRTPAGKETTRFSTVVPWDLNEFPSFREVRKSVQTGVDTVMVSMSGQVSVSARKMYTTNPVNAWQFTLPPGTRQWAYRISVGQGASEARQLDARKLSQALRSGSMKLITFQPETALAAFALGAAIDMTISTTGEDVTYAITDRENWQKFSKEEPCQAFVYQGNINVDVQRRHTPLEGTYFFALKNDNLIDDITVTLEIEAVTEKPVFETQIVLEPVK